MSYFLKYAARCASFRFVLPSVPVIHSSSLGWFFNSWAQWGLLADLKRTLRRDRHVYDQSKAGSSSANSNAGSSPGRTPASPGSPTTLTLPASATTAAAAEASATADLAAADSDPSSASSALCPIDVERLLAGESYREMVSRWNLPLWRDTHKDRRIECLDDYLKIVSFASPHCLRGNLLLCSAKSRLPFLFLVFFSVGCCVAELLHPLHAAHLDPRAVPQRR